MYNIPKNILCRTFILYKITWKWYVVFVKNTQEKNICGMKYSYKYIFKQMFINILLDYSPVNVEDFYGECVTVIKNNSF